MNDNYNNLFQQALALFSSGKLDKAEEICRKLSNYSIKHSDVYNLLAVIQDKKGNTEQSILLLNKAIKINPNNHLYYINLSEFYKKKNDIENAIFCLQKSIQINPKFHSSKYKLANIFRVTGYKKEAEKLYKEAITLNPNDYMSFQNLGNIYFESGNYLEAAANYYNALRINPEEPEILVSLANAFLEIKNNYQAEYYYRSCLAFKPDHLIALKSLSVMFENQGRFHEALEFYKKYMYYSAISSGNENIAQRIHLDTTLPFFNLTNFEINQTRKKLLENIEKYSDFSKYDINDFAKENISIPSQLAYQGIDNRELNTRYARIFHKYFERKKIEFNQGKIRIGFLVTKSHEGIFIKFMQGIINNLSDNDFEIYLIFSQNNTEDKIKEKISNSKVNFHYLSEKITDSAKSISHLKLDIIYYWEVGTDSDNYFLPFFRLAPVQCTSLGWPDTTGIPEMDYFISSDLIETELSESYYTEKLIKLKKLPFNYEKPSLTEELKPLEFFGLSNNKNIYLCVQNLRKIHPDFDKIIAEILRRDKKGLVIFVKHQFDKISELLDLRIKITYPEISERVIFVNRLGFNEYLSLIHHSDVLLDSIYFGGANTSYECFAMNRPIVTMPWTHERGRFTMGCYKQMGIEGCIAHSFEDYIELSVKVANDKIFRNKLISDIEKNNHYLFNDISVVDEYISFFKKVARN